MGFCLAFFVWCSVLSSLVEGGRGGEEGGRFADSEPVELDPGSPDLEECSGVFVVSHLGSVDLFAKQRVSSSRQAVLVNRAGSTTNL